MGKRFLFLLCVFLYNKVPTHQTLISHQSLGTLSIRSIGFCATSINPNPWHNFFTSDQSLRTTPFFGASYPDSSPILCHTRKSLGETSQPTNTCRNIISIVITSIKDLAQPLILENHHLFAPYPSLFSPWHIFNQKHHITLDTINEHLSLLYTQIGTTSESKSASTKKKLCATQSHNLFVDHLTCGASALSLAHHQDLVL